MPLLLPLIKTAAAVAASAAATSSPPRSLWATTVGAGASTGAPKVKERERERRGSCAISNILLRQRSRHPLQNKYNQKGDTLASCGADRTVRTWHQLRSSRRSGKERTGGRWAPDAVLEESQARAVRAVAWAPPPAAARAAAKGKKGGEGRQSRLQRRRRRLATASFDASVAVWEEERPAAPPPSSGEIDGENEIDDDDRDNGGDDEPTLWSQVALLQGHESEVKGVAWSPLPGAIEAGSSEEEEDEEEVERGVDNTDGDGGKNPSSRPPPPPLLADGEGCLLATCGRDRSVWLWESIPGTGHSTSNCEFECVDVKQGHAGDVKSLAWHPSGSVLASASYDGTVRLWLPDGGACQEGSGGGGGGNGTNAAAAAVGDEWLCGQEIKEAHGGETVWSIAFEPRILRKSKNLKQNKSSREVRAASCGGDGRVSVWRCPLPSSSGSNPEPATETLHWEAGAVARSAFPPLLGGKVRPAYSVDWSPCGQWIACGGGDDFVRVFRAPPRDEGEEGEEEKISTTVAGEEVVLELAAEIRASPPCEVNCVKWRRGRKKGDPPMLAAACDDGVVRLWSLQEEEGGGE